MVRTVSELATEIRANLDTTSGRLTDTILLPWLNEGAGQLYAALVNKFEDYFVADPPLSKDIVASQESYLMANETPNPDDAHVFKLRGVDYKIDSVNYRPLTRMELSARNDFSDVLSNVSFGDPAFYFVHGNKIFLRPIPSAAKTGGLRLWYVPRWERWTAVDSTEVPLQFENNPDWLNVVVYHCCMMGEIRDQGERASTFKTLKDEVLLNIQSQAKSRDAGQPRSVNMIRRRRGR